MSMTDTIQDFTGQNTMSGMNLSERYIVAVIRNAVKWFQDNPTAWSRIIGNIEEAELGRFTTYFEKRPPSVRLGYARANDPMPQINVILDSEKGTVDFVGDLAGVVGNFRELVNQGGVINTNIKSQSVSIHVHADHPEITLFLYHMVHSSILSSLGFFAKMNLFNFSFISGSEVLPQELYLPETIYSRVLTYSFEGVGQGVVPLPEPPPEAYIFVSGVRINDTITGGVKPI